MDYRVFANLQEEFTLPEKGILSRVLHKDEKVNVTLFGFAAGGELTAFCANTGCSLLPGGRSRIRVRNGQGQR